MPVWFVARRWPTRCRRRRRRLQCPRLRRRRCHRQAPLAGRSRPPPPPLQQLYGATWSAAPRHSRPLSPPPPQPSASTFLYLPPQPVLSIRRCAAPVLRRSPPFAVAPAAISGRSNSSPRAAHRRVTCVDVALCTHKHTLYISPHHKRTGKLIHTHSHAQHVHSRFKPIQSRAASLPPAFISNSAARIAARIQPTAKAVAPAAPPASGLKFGATIRTGRCQCIAVGIAARQWAPPRSGGSLIP